ncbi:hypothetical protein ACEQ8H_005896 [Pleosporales sp. CAS-2024a]
MPALSATYCASPAAASPPPQAFTHHLPALADPPSTHDRVAYLAALQSALKTLQGHLNTFLTQKMDQDQDRAAGADQGPAKDEERYGEEVVDED